MLDLNTIYATDHHKEVAGTWVAIGHGGELFLARAGNEKWTKAVRKLPNNIITQLERGTLDETVEAKINATLIADHILLDWKNLTENGKSLAYSKETALRVLLALKEFRLEVMVHADNIENFRIEKLETDAKNSESGSTGT